MMITLLEEFETRP